MQSNLKQTLSKLKLPSFLLGRALFLVGAATAATVYTFRKNPLLNNGIKDVAPRGINTLSIIFNMILIHLQFISRMIYEIVKRENLSKILSKFSGKSQAFSSSSVL